MGDENILKVAKLIADQLLEISESDEEINDRFLRIIEKLNSWTADNKAVFYSYLLDPNFYLYNKIADDNFFDKLYSKIKNDVKYIDLNIILSRMERAFDRRVKLNNFAQKLFAKVNEISNPRLFLKHRLLASYKIVEWLNQLSPQDRKYVYSLEGNNCLHEFILDKTSDKVYFSPKNEKLYYDVIMSYYQSALKSIGTYYALEPWQFFTSLIMSLEASVVKQIFQQIKLIDNCFTTKNNFKILCERIHIDIINNDDNPEQLRQYICGDAAAIFTYMTYCYDLADCLKGNYNFFLDDIYKAAVNHGFEADFVNMIRESVSLSSDKKYISYLKIAINYNSFASVKDELNEMLQESEKELKEKSQVQHDEGAPSSDKSSEIAEERSSNNKVLGSKNFVRTLTQKLFFRSDNVVQQSK